MMLEKQSDYHMVRRDVLIFEHLKKAEKEGRILEALYLSVHMLQNQNLKVVNRQALVDTFAALSPMAEAATFSLHNDDLIVVFNKKCHDEVLSCLVKVRFLFHDDPLLKDAEDLEQIKFAQIFDLATQKDELRAKIKKVMQEPLPEQKKSSGLPRTTPVSVFNTSNKKVKRNLTPEM